MEKKLSLSVCFQLGRALRYSDADDFLTLYDSLLRDGRVEQDQQVITIEMCEIIHVINRYKITFLVINCKGMVSSDIRAQSRRLLIAAHSNYTLGPSQYTRCFHSNECGGYSVSAAVLSTGEAEECGGDH